jgi:hypothetical protein
MFAVTSAVHAQNSCRYLEKPNESLTVRACRLEDRLGWSVRKDEQLYNYGTLWNWVLSDRIGFSVPTYLDCHKYLDAEGFATSCRFDRTRWC